MSRASLGLISAAFCLVLSGCAGLATGAEGQPPPRDGGNKAAALKPTREPTPASTPEPTKPPLAVDDLLGEDGRLTVLMLGSDIREGIIGERTDAIIVGTIDPGNGKVTMVSLPRDTVNVPIAPGKAYGDRINTLYWDFQRSTGKKKTALSKTKQALSYAFGTEIDYYALVDFNGLVRLVNSVGGIDVTLEEPLVDPTMHLGKKGLRLKPGDQHLDGKHALAFSRTRHTDSDYARSERQQQVIAAGADKVRDRGSDYLPALVELARKKIVTDLPMRAAPALLELAQDAKLNSPKSVVLAPGRWARQLPGTYTISPRVIEVQKMFDRAFRPLD